MNRADIEQLLKERILILDGAMGTMIQRLALTEDDFRVNGLIHSGNSPMGCYDILAATRPDLIASIHEEYIMAGADIITTNSFNANGVSLARYSLEGKVLEINRHAAEIARLVAGRNSTPNRQLLVAGSIGPTNVSLSATGNKTGFSTLVSAYAEQAEGLISGDVDLLLVETIFDKINAMAAVRGIKEANDQTGKTIPVMISATLSDEERIPSGQTINELIEAISEIEPLSVGLNCGFGADSLIRQLPSLQSAPFYISLHPNAGLPDSEGVYPCTPMMFADKLRAPMEEGLLNIVGGCCGTTPQHIAAIAEVASGCRPRVHK